MKVLKSYWLVVACLLIATCSRAWANIPNLPYDTPTKGTVSSVTGTAYYTVGASVNDVLNFTLVATASTSGSFGPCIVLNDPNGTPVDSAGGYGATDVEMNGYVVKIAGTYQVLITDCANAATGDFTIFVQKSNVPAGAVGLAYASVTSGVIGSVTQSNAYTFSANVGDVLLVTVVATKSTSTNAFGPCILLYNTTGTPILDSAGGYGATDVEMNGYKVAATGKFNLFIKDCGDVGTGNYVVFLQKANAPINSVPIVDDQVQSGAIASVAQSNAYTFIGTYKDVMNFTVATTKSTSGSLGPCILIYDHSGNQDGAAGGYGAEVVTLSDFLVSATATFNVFVKDCADVATGTYNLSTSCHGVCDLPIPVLTSMSPSSAPAGSSGVTVTLTGESFANVESNSYAQWINNSTDTDLSTTFFSTTKLTATIPSSDLTKVGMYEVRVCTPPPGGGCSNELPFKVLGPVITSLSPASAIAGGPAFTLTVKGVNLLTGSVVNWNGIGLKPTVWVSNTELQATVPAADIITASATTSTYSITVTNSLGTSGAVSFPVYDPVPVLTSISPSTIIAGGTTFTLTATGSGFVHASQIRWNGTALTTTYVSPTELQAPIPATDILDGDISVTVYNPPLGGGTSAAKTLAIDNPVPVLMTVAPASATHGGGSFTLTANGFDFNEGAKILWNGVALATTFVSDMQLTATVPATDIAAAGKATITVTNPAPTPSASNGVTFTIN